MPSSKKTNPISLQFENHTFLQPKPHNKTGHSDPMKRTIKSAEISKANILPDKQKFRRLPDIDYNELNSMNPNHKNGQKLKKPKRIVKNKFLRRVSHKGEKPKVIDLTEDEPEKTQTDTCIDVGEETTSEEKPTENTAISLPESPISNNIDTNCDTNVY